MRRRIRQLWWWWKRVRGYRLCQKVPAVGDWVVPTSGWPDHRPRLEHGGRVLAVRYYGGYAVVRWKTQGTHLETSWYGGCGMRTLRKSLKNPSRREVRE